MQEQDKTKGTMKSFSRRRILSAGSMLAATAAVAPALVREAQGEPTSKLKVVITGGHPGDPEYGCGGTISRLTELGHEAVLLYLNQGEPVESAARLTGYRMEEAKKASAILKARPAYAGQIDGNAVVDQLHYVQFREIVEKENPNVVFTHWPIDNHADHRAISMLVYDAWLHTRKQFSLFYYEVSNGEDTQQFAPSDYVDISASEPKKRLACYAHATQAPDKFYALQDAVARWRGIESGHTRAEAFIRHVQSPRFALPV
jgi:LmbE family N-acetylglucosaminyl deacetylase